MMIPVFCAARVSPAVEAQLGKAWLSRAMDEGHRPSPLMRPRKTATEAIAELLSDGEWHSSADLAAAGGIATNNLRKYVKRLCLDRRSVPRPTGGHIVEWRLP